MFAIRNKKTGRLLVVEHDIMRQRLDYGQGVISKVTTELFDQQEGGMVWATTDRDAARMLHATGTIEDHTWIHFDGFSFEDLEVVELAIVN